MAQAAHAHEVHRQGTGVRRRRGGSARRDPGRLRPGYAVPARGTEIDFGTRVTSARECSTAGRIHHACREECRGGDASAVVGIRREPGPEADQQAAEGAVNPSLVVSPWRTRSVARQCVIPALSPAGTHSMRSGFAVTYSGRARGILRVEAPNLTPARSLRF